MANPLNSMDWGNWLYGLCAGLIGGGASAVYAGVIASAVDPHLQMGSPASLKVMGWLFLFSAIKDGAFYLKQNPMPKWIVHTSTVETVSNPNPATVVTKTDTTTTQEPAK